MLQHAYTSSPATDGASALREIALSVPDVVLLDIEMPAVMSIPSPVSLTVSPARAGWRSSSTSMHPPRGRNLTAFDKRFDATCCNRSGSPSTQGFADPSRVAIVTDFPVPVVRRAAT